MICTRVKYYRSNYQQNAWKKTKLKITVKHIKRVNSPSRLAHIFYINNGFVKILISKLFNIVLYHIFSNT